MFENKIQLITLGIASFGDLMTRIFLILDKNEIRIVSQDEKCITLDKAIDYRDKTVGEKTFNIVQSYTQIINKLKLLIA